MQSLTHWMNARVDARPLGIARIVVGLAVLIKAFIILVALHQFFDGEFLRFTYPVQVPVLDSTQAANVIAGLWIAFGAFFLLGLGRGVAGVGLTLVIFYTLGIDQQFYSNHLYLIGTVVALLTLAGAGSRYSLDSWNGSGADTVPQWPITLLKLQLTSVYLFAALSKINGSFLDGTVFEHALDPGMRSQLVNVAGLETLAVLAIATELFLAFAFWWRRTRWLALPVGLGFHAMNVVVMERGGAIEFVVFGMIMIAMILLFFSDVLERVLTWKMHRGIASTDQAAPEAT